MQSRQICGLILIILFLFMIPAAWATDAYSYSYWCFTGYVDPNQFTAVEIAFVMVQSQPIVTVQASVLNNCLVAIRVLEASVNVYGPSQGQPLGYAYVNGLPLNLPSGSNTSLTATVGSYYSISMLTQYRGQMITVKGSATACILAWWGCLGPSFQVPIEIQRQT